MRISTAYRVRGQRGLTLLEVLIALSIFAMIGVASYRVLATVISVQQIGDQHSEQLYRLQKAVRFIDADFQQTVDRAIRVGDGSRAALSLEQGRGMIEFTRGGWRNPLSLHRSALQRVAYDIGFHPQYNNRQSPFYRDQTRYLRRHYWSALDRPADSQATIQALLPDIEELDFTVLDQQFERHQQWPPQQPNKNKKEPTPMAVELRLQHQTLGEVIRFYKVF